MQNILFFFSKWKTLALFYKKLTDEDKNPICKYCWQKKLIVCEIHCIRAFLNKKLPLSIGFTYLRINLLTMEKVVSTWKSLGKLDQ